MSYNKRIWQALRVPQLGTERADLMTIGHVATTINTIEELLELPEGVDGMVILGILVANTHTDPADITLHRGAEDSADRVTLAIATVGAKKTEFLIDYPLGILIDDDLEVEVSHLGLITSVWAVSV